MPRGSGIDAQTDSVTVSENSATTGGRRQATVERLFQLAGVEGRAGGLKDSPSGSVRAKGAP